MQIVQSMRQVWMAAVILLIIIALAGCGGGDLAPDESEANGSQDAASSPSLVGTTWEWVEFQDTAEQNSFTVEDSSAYTLTFNDDETVSMQADCNQASGNYTLEGSSLSIALGPTTLAECGPESRYDEYLARLGEVASYVIADGQLFLNLQVDAGNLVFEPAAE